MFIINPIGYCDFLDSLQSPRESYKKSSNSLELLLFSIDSILEIPQKHFNTISIKLMPTHTLKKIQHTILYPSQHIPQGEKEKKKHKHKIGFVCKKKS